VFSIELGCIEFATSAVSRSRSQLHRVRDLSQTEPAIACARLQPRDYLNKFMKRASRGITLLGRRSSTCAGSSGSFDFVEMQQGGGIVLEM